MCCLFTISISRVLAWALTLRISENSSQKTIGYILGEQRPTIWRENCFQFNRKKIFRLYIWRECHWWQTLCSAIIADSIAMYMQIECKGLFYCDIDSISVYDTKDLILNLKIEFQSRFKPKVFRQNAIWIEFFSIVTHNELKEYPISISF